MYTATKRPNWSVRVAFTFYCCCRTSQFLIGTQCESCVRWLIRSVGPRSALQPPAPVTLHFPKRTHCSQSECTTWAASAPSTSLPREPLALLEVQTFPFLLHVPLFPLYNIVSQLSGLLLTPLPSHIPQPQRTVTHLPLRQLLDCPVKISHYPLVSPTSPVPCLA